MNIFKTNHQMGTGTLHAVGIVPPPSILSTLMRIGDRLHLVSPSSRKAILPHLSLTGVYEHDESVEAWKAELRKVVSLFRPFTIKVVEPLRMSNGSLPDNFSLPVPTTSELEAISRAVAAVTHRHFPDLDEHGLRSMVDHIYLLENIPDGPRYFVVREARKLCAPHSFEVDRIELLDLHCNSVDRETILLLGAKHRTDTLADELKEDHRWILAMMHGMGGFVESKLKYHKMLFLVDYEEMDRRNRYDYAPFTYGPWSSRLESLTLELERSGLIAYQGNARNLTERGKEVAATIFSKLLPREREFIARCTRKHGSKSTTEILTYVHQQYPEWRVFGSAYPDD